MIKKLSSGIFLVLFFVFQVSGQDKSKKTYELIYEDVQALKRQIIQLEKNIETNSEDIKIIKSQLEELLKLSRFLQSEQASFREDQKNLPAQYQILLGKLDSISSQFSGLAEELVEIKRASAQLQQLPEQEEKPDAEQISAPEKKPSRGKKKEQEEEEQPKSPISPNLSPQEVYNMAYSDYLKGNFQLAIDGFKIYLEQFSDSPVVDNALYWIGECFFSQKQYEEAIQQFNELILSYPDGDKIPAAYLKKGISLVELGKKDQALSVFKLLISKYPLEEETKIAQQKIKELISENERHQ